MVFVNNTILYNIIDLHFLIDGVIPQICNPTGELVTSIGITNNEANVEIETHRPIAEIKASDFSM